MWFASWLNNWFTNWFGSSTSPEPPIPPYPYPDTWAGLDLSSDYAIFDEGDLTGQEEQTLVYHSSLPNSSPISCSGSIRLDTKQSEAEQTNGIYTKTDVYYDLRTQDFTTVSYTPNVGDYLYDSDGDKFWVMEVRKPIFGDYWGLECRCPKLYYGLTDEIDWLKPTATQLQQTNVYGDKISDELAYPVKGHYYCRIQPNTAEIIDGLGKRGFLNHYKCHLFEELDLDFGDIFMDQVGDRYKVISWSSKKNLASLFEVELEIQP